MLAIFKEYWVYILGLRQSISKALTFTPSLSSGTGVRSAHNERGCPQRDIDCGGSSSYLLISVNWSDLKWNIEQEQEQGQFVCIK